MGSLVPNIKMSRGNNRKTKFNISSNTHTTAEVGYLQPIYSKVLLPKSDLKLKVSDFVRMSSLLVPTFGDLSLRHWFNCTPLSSLWACYGSFMSQSEYPDYDSNSGTSIRHYMPMASINSILNLIGRIDYETFSGALYGNLLYLRNVGADSRHTQYGIMSFTDFYDGIISRNGGVAGIGNINKSFAAVYKACKGSTQEEVKVSELRRQRLWQNFITSGVVVKNDAELQTMLKNGSSATTFPSPTECPYVVVRGYSTTYEDDTTYKDAPYGLYLTPTTDALSDLVGSFEVLPLTTRMFQGDSTNALYVNGWSHNAKKQTSEGKNYYRHPTGNSNGWSLSADDSYFTGDIQNFDYSGYLFHTSGSTEVIDYGYGATWSRRFKRLRKLFIGLGYQFTPTDTQPQTIWKLMHYYKAWFDMFYPKRDTQYYQTPLARMVMFMSYHGGICFPDMIDRYYYLQSQSEVGYDGKFLNDFVDMLFACADAKYLLPLDYYSLADPNPQASDTNCHDESIKDNAVVNVIGAPGTDREGESDNNRSGLPWYGDGVIVSSNNIGVLGMVNNVNSTNSLGSGTHIDGLTIKLAEKLTKFLVKKRIVGKSISDRMRAIYGAVDPHDKSHESTWCFGTSSTGINISAVMSQSESDEMHLGDYAGQGIGGSTSRTFSVDGNDADIYIVTIMSAIVPKISYFQGHSRENMIGISPNEFISPIWDGVGYDDVHASEYIADITDNSQTYSELSGAGRTMNEINGQVIGLVPRGTWYKVNPHDTLNGDMSLPTTKDSLSPYVLTKDIDRDFSIAPIDMRTINPNTFNKIFNESNDLDDHYIIQAHIEADMYSPLKSISTSYDTFDSDEDGTIEVSHS